MEFLNKNYITTTTSIDIDSNTSTVQNFLRWDKTFQYSTDGYADDSLTASVTFNLDATTTINRIANMGHNLKEYTIFYNGVTANTLDFINDSPTTVSSFITNSATSQIFEFDDIEATSITIDMKKTMVANNEKAIGYFLISALKLELERQPSAKNYSPVYTPDQVVHKLSDGGVRINTTVEKFSTSIKYANITRTFRDNLKDLFLEHDSFVFLGELTQDSWDEVIHEVVWPGKFEFLKYSDNAINAGFSGKITLMEIS